MTTPTLDYHGLRLTIDHVRCTTCGTRVSQDVIAPAVEGVDGLLIRAYVQCPECIEREASAEDTQA